MSKHIDPRHQDPDITNLTDVPSDLERNPGIGGSKGSRMAGVDPHEIDADSTSEGDVVNETTPEGGVDPRHIGRRNR